MVTYLDRATVTAVIIDDTARPNPYADGYGPKIPTRYRLKLTDGRTRRVYVMCWSNSGTPYVTVGGQTIVLSPEVEWLIEDWPSA